MSIETHKNPEIPRQGDGDENKRFSIAIFVVSKDYANQQQERAYVNPQQNGEGS